MAGNKTRGDKTTNNNSCRARGIGIIHVPVPFGAECIQNAKWERGEGNATMLLAAGLCCGTGAGLGREMRNKRTSQQISASRPGLGVQYKGVPIKDGGDDRRQEPPYRDFRVAAFDTKYFCTGEVPGSQTEKQSQVCT